MPRDRAAPSIQRGERGGIPLLWTPADDPEVQAALVFRVGIADEPYAWSGITHLIEHLAIAALDPPDHPHNGWVSLDQTAFTARGTAEEVVAYLQAIVTGLGQLPFDRLDLERGILETEAATSSAAVESELMRLRYGLAAAGRYDLPEPGLRRATPDRLRRWVADHFTREAAVLCWVGPEPPLLELGLTQGATPPRLCAADPVVPLPFATDGPDDAVVIAMTAPRTVAASVLRLVLRDRMHQVLRNERGLIYDVREVFDVLPGAVTHITFSAGTRPGAAPEVLDLMVRCVEQVAEEGCTDAQVASVRRELERSFHHDDAREPLLLEAALQLLEGRPIRDATSLLEELAAITPAEIQALAQEAKATLMVQVPPSAPPPGPPFSGAMDIATPEAVDGQVFISRALLASGRVTLTVGDTGLSVLGPGDERPVTVLWADVVAVTHELSGVLQLVGRDASWFEVELGEFADAEEIRALVNAAVDPEVIVPPIGAEHVPAVQAAARRDLLERWTVRDEVRRLPGELEPGEQLLRVAKAMHGPRPGLLALTDRRLLFVTVKVMGELVSHEVRHGVSAGATAASSRLGNHTLTVDARPEPRRYWGFTRKKVARAMAEALNAQAGTPGQPRS